MKKLSIFALMLFTVAAFAFASAGEVETAAVPEEFQEMTLEEVQEMSLEELEASIFGEKASAPTEANTSCVRYCRGVMEDCLNDLPLCTCIGIFSACIAQNC